VTEPAPLAPVPTLASRGRLTVTEQELAEWGERLGRASTAPLVIAISGELGAGKTTLVRAICHGYGVRDDVTSPTYTLVHEYKSGRSKVYHLDLYRLRNAGELTALGWDEIMNEDALVIVEWPERAAGCLPPGHVPISLRHILDDSARRILYAGGHT
jgi:tRNA threonylcarbamoyladenosine biosynthesis protein TsaE